MIINGNIQVEGHAWQTITVTDTGTQNNYAPTGLTFNGHTILRCNNASDLTITGFSNTGIADGTLLIIESVGAGNVYFAHNSGSSSAGNKLSNFATSGNTPLAAGTGTAIYKYGTTSSVWRLISHEQGAFIDYSSVSTFTGWSSFTTKTLRYRLSGTCLHWAFYLAGTSNATTTSFTMPFTASASLSFQVGVCLQMEDNGVTSNTPGMWLGQANSATLGLSKDANSDGYTASGTKVLGASGVLIVVN